MSKTQKNGAPKEAVHKRVWSLKNHPFVVPVVTCMVLFFVTMMGFIAFGGGTTIGPTDSKVVTVYVDNTEQILPTRAKNVQALIDKLGITINEGDVVEPGLDAPILTDNFNINIYRARPIVLIDNNKRTVVKTADQSPRIAAREAGIVVYPEDEVIPEAPEDLLDEGVVGDRYIIDRATPLTLILYGNISGIRTQAETVGELLDEKQVKTEPSDTVTPARDTPLRKDMKITITREGQKIATVEEAIAPKTEYVDDPNVLTGQEVVKEEGKPGKKVVTYDIQLDADGKEIKRKKLQEITTIKPERRLISRGTKIIISNPSDNVKLGQSLAAGRGWTGQEFYCLYQLWQKESGWNTTAGNTSSGAYGIPQALPGSKMGSAGADWLTNPATQINWGMGYIAGRYGAPCAAWATSQAQGWY